VSEAWQKRGHQFTNSLQLRLHFVSDEGALFVSDEAAPSDLVLVLFSFSSLPRHFRQRLGGASLTF